MILQFGAFQIDSLQRQAYHGINPLCLPPKLFAVLLLLAENSGRIVEKDEILETIWKGVSVLPANLTQTVFLLRNALKDCDPHDYIITVPGRGYQFAAHVKKRTTAYSEAGRSPGRSSLAAQAARVDGSDPSLQLVQPLLQDRHQPASSAWHVAHANTQCLLMSAGEEKPQRALAAIQDAVLRALEMDPKAGYAYAPLGFLRCHLDRDWAKSENDFLHCLDDHPGNLLASHWYAELLTSLQRFDDALQVLQRAEKLDPDSILIQTDIAQTLFYAREYRDCETRIRKVFGDNRSFPRAGVLLGCTYRMLGRLMESIRVLERVVSQKASAIALATLAASYRASGNFGRAREILEQLQMLRTKRYIPTYTVAFAADSLGEAALALDSLEQAVRENDYWILWLRFKTFDSIRLDPRFQKLLQSDLS